MNQTTQKPIQTLQELAQNLRTDCYYFVSMFSAGDTYYLCALKKALEQKYKGKIIFIIKPTHKAILEIFANIAYIICEKSLILNFTQTPQCFEIDGVVSTPTLGKLFPAHSDILQRAIITQTSMLNWNLRWLDLPLDTRGDFPTNLPKLSESLREKLAKIALLNKIILFCPEANSCPSLPPIIFKYECNKLLNQGYKIIVNCNFSSIHYKRIDYVKHFTTGIYDLNLSLKDVIALSLCCAGVISTRSGFCDIIAPHCENLKIYYTNFYYWWQGRLKDINPTNALKEVLIYDEPIHKHFLRATRNLGEFSLPFKLYQRYIAKGFLRRVRTPFTLYFKIYLGHKKDKMKKSSPKCEVATNQAAQSHSEPAQEFKNSSNQNLPNQTLNDKEMREFMKEFVQNELSQTYEFRLGLLLQKACENFWRGGFVAFPFAYLKLRKKKRHLQRISDII